MIRISKVISEYLLQERNICNRNEIKHAAFLAGILMMVVMIVMMILIVVMMMMRQWRCTLFLCCFYPSTVEQIFFSWEQMTNAKAAFFSTSINLPMGKPHWGKVWIGNCTRIFVYLTQIWQSNFSTFFMYLMPLLWYHKYDPLIWPWIQSLID